MSKYIDKDKVLEYIIFKVVGKDITCGELARGIESLPTIEVSEDCISCQQAINAVENTDIRITEAEWNELTNALSNLPLAINTVEKPDLNTTERGFFCGLAERRGEK